MVQFSFDMFYDDISLKRMLVNFVKVIFLIEWRVITYWPDKLC
jgi:hypothetical protein